MTQRKPFKELDLSNAFLFAAALQDEETCQLVLEMILGIRIGKVRVKAEHSILYNSDFRSIRLDVYASDVMDIQYDLEMQNDKEKELPKRSRYYHAVLDMSSLKPGQGYEDLKPGYVIFICSFDPFGKGLYRYTFEQRCEETKEPLGDGSKRIFLSTRGKNTEDVPEVLVHFLQYVEKSTDDCVKKTGDGSIARLHSKIMQLKENHDLEGQYMKFEELLEDREKVGRKEGRKQGEDRICSLLERLVADGRVGDLERVSRDVVFREELLKEYNL